MEKAKKKVAERQEAQSKRAVFEELFNDFYSSRGRVYRVNFMRGVFFGVGSVVGGTIVVALMLFVLGMLADIPGGIGDFIQYIVETVQKRQ